MEDQEKETGGVGGMITFFLIITLVVLVGAVIDDLITPGGGLISFLVTH